MERDWIDHDLFGRTVGTMLILILLQTSSLGGAHLCFNQWCHKYLWLNNEYLDSEYELMWEKEFLYFFCLCLPDQPWQCSKSLSHLLHTEGSRICLHAENRYSSVEIGTLRSWFSVTPWKSRVGMNTLLIFGWLKEVKYSVMAEFREVYCWNWLSCGITSSSSQFLGKGLERVFSTLDYFFSPE